MINLNKNEIRKTSLFLWLFFFVLFLVSILFSWRAYFGVIDEKSTLVENVYLSPKKGRNGPAMITITSGGRILYTARCIGLEFSICRESNINKGGVHAKSITFLELIKGDGVLLEINNSEEYIKNSYSQELAVQKYLDVERRTPNMFLILVVVFFSVYLICLSTKIKK